SSARQAHRRARQYYVAGLVAPAMLPLFLQAFAASAAAEQSPTFEVASVKAHKPAVAEGRTGGRIDSVPGSLTIRNASMGSCIKWAWQVQDYQISGPSWLNDERYDIVAKAASPVRTDELRQMLRTLLAGRFQLQVHRETKELPVYTLVTAQSGPKLHKAEPDSNTDMRGENGSFVFRGTSMPQFAEDLSTLSQVDRPVLDRTGIPGTFDFSLKFGDSNDEMKRALVAGDGPSLFTIIQEQLGLKLDAQKGPVEMLVIDHVERIPTEN
ncbi:MAG TPA: TIGR03435 family protein, partial [Bryobacteraceae bacterium]